MFRSILFILSFVFLLSFNTNALASHVKEAEGKSGVKSWYVEEHSLPIVAIKVAFKNAGYAYDPKDRQGLGFYVSGMLNEGAGRFSSVDFQRNLEEKAIQMGFDLDQDNFYISIKTLKNNLGLASEMLGLALTKPHFDKEAMERVRTQLIAINQKREENPGSLATEKFLSLLFGNHSYGSLKTGGVENIKKISNTDLHEYVKNNFSRQNVVISIVGDVSEKESSAITDILTLNLPEKQMSNPELAPASYTAGKSERIKKKYPQAVAVFGQRGVSRKDRDFYPAYIANYILGDGGFKSRLMQLVREKNGLAYSVNTEIASLKYGSYFAGAVATRADKILESVDLIKSEIGRLQVKGVTSEELEDAKNYLIGSFPLRLDSNNELANFLTVMQIEDLGMDFLEKRNDYIRAVTVDQVNNFSKSFFDPDKLDIVIVGE